jgi:hypothetical protein
MVAWIAMSFHSSALCCSNSSGLGQVKSRHCQSRGAVGQLGFSKSVWDGMALSMTPPSMVSRSGSARVDLSKEANTADNRSCNATEST